MIQLILVFTLVVALNGGGAKGESQRSWRPPSPATTSLTAVTPTQFRHADSAPHGEDNTAGHPTPPCYPSCKVTGSLQSQVSHGDEHKIKENTAWNFEGDTSTAANAINLIKKREAISSTKKIQDTRLQIEDDLVKETEDMGNKDTINSIFNKGDLAIPYDSLGWFSKAVEAAMDGSLFIGLGFGIMFICASLLSGAIGLFEETCLICAFIGYANTVGP